MHVLWCSLLPWDAGGFSSICVRALAAAAQAQRVVVLCLALYSTPAALSSQNLVLLQSLWTVDIGRIYVTMVFLAAEMGCIAYLAVEDQRTEPDAQVVSSSSLHRATFLRSSQRC